MNEEFNKLLEETEEELEEYEETTLEQIEETIDHISNIIRFLDGKIVTDLSYEINSRGNIQLITDYYEEPGILIYQQKQPYTPEELETKAEFRFNDMDNVPKDHIVRYFGVDIYLTRERNIVKFKRDEVDVPGYPDKKQIHLFDEEELNINELLEEYPDFPDKFYGFFKKVIIESINKNPKKRGTFQKIIDYINRIEEKEEKNFR
ncbi:MAG: hypothetical protein JW776_02245 [Candidatus Lokiarchaeota archaeon]|nr:hypothetical protein [Candidatus Lokiarchaeota archaeon]